MESNKKCGKPQYLLLLKSFFECDKIYTNKKCGITHKLFIGVSLWL